MQTMNDTINYSKLNPKNCATLNAIIDEQTKNAKSPILIQRNDYGALFTEGDTSILVFQNYNELQATADPSCIEFFNLIVGGI